MKLTWFEEIFEECYVDYITMFLFCKSYPKCYQKTSEIVLKGSDLANYYSQPLQ